MIQPELPVDPPVERPSAEQREEWAIAEADNKLKERNLHMTGETVTAAEASEIFDPTTGELVLVGDADAMIDAYERVLHADGELYAAKQRLRRAIADLAKGDAKTQRVRGERRRCRVVLPGIAFEQSILKEAYHAYPQFRGNVLTIDRLRVRMREYDKITRESGPADWTLFRDMVSSAANPSTALPTITIEE